MQIAALLTDIENYVKKLFFQHQRPFLIYHNLQHTLQVVAHTKEIAEFYRYNKLDLFMILAAAWFHDTGYLLADTNMHELKSIEILVDFLSSKHVANNIIEEISKYIMATKMPVNPHSLSEKIICDADLYHLGTDEFFEINKQVKAEMEAKLDKPLENWHNSTLAFMIAHHYYTPYCQQLLSYGKQKNIQKLISQNIES
ncbi:MULTISPECIES: HD domain-containing protein [Niastella]|uniref:HD domain-containing protein n=1 Tax=Niastella soli TaxID=2821487 RepID=A0ABS3Z0G9_9BACT|nr:HD domain-containing protein [Niastella soli]MBO9202871.1 HD domain-containing protein [Niastella soli]